MLRRATATAAGLASWSAITPPSGWTLSGYPALLWTLTACGCGPSEGLVWACLHLQLLEQQACHIML